MKKYRIKSREVQNLEEDVRFLKRVKKIQAETISIMKRNAKMRDGLINYYENHEKDWIDQVERRDNLISFIQKNNDKDRIFERLIFVFLWVLTVIVLLIK